MVTFFDVTLRVTADRAGAWLRHPAPVVTEETFQVRLTPPTLGVTSTFHYAKQGGCEVVTYRVGESSVKDGVRAGDLWFPGFPLPGGGKQDRFAIFAIRSPSIWIARRRQRTARAATRASPTRARRRGATPVTLPPRTRAR